MKKILALTLALGLAAPALAQNVKAAPKKAAVAPAAAEKPAVRSKRAVEIYGFLKLTAAADTGIFPGNYAAWARSGSKDNQFNATANETRLGLDFLKEGEGPRVLGKLEMDFMGGGTENKANPMMRHAYLEICNSRSDTALLAGQTWDVIAPLNPMSNNYSVYWWAGNIGYRRPQVRLTKKAGSATFQAAAARTVGDVVTDKSGSSPVTYTATGEDSGFPTLQGRLALAPCPSFTLGVAGHFGEEEAGNTDYVTSSAVADLVLKIGSKAEIRGEAWMGKNLDAYLGGIGQGISTGNPYKEIHASGGWGSLQAGPFGATRLYMGAGVDNPANQDLKPGDRSLNRAGWAGMSRTVASGTTLDLEYSYLDTKYHHAEGGYSHRGQMTLLYGF